MKPAIPRTADDLAPKGSAQRQQQLRAVLDALGKADFPGDLPRFEPFAAPLALDTEEGRRRRSLLIKGRETTFLLTLAIDLVRTSAAPWFRAQAAYQGPQFDAIHNEPDPLRRRKLLQSRDKQRAAAVAELREALTGQRRALEGLDNFLAGIEKRRAAPSETPTQKERARVRRQRDRTPCPDYSEQTNWGEQMTVAGYMQAVGRCRTTINTFLNANRLRSLPRPHPTAPAHYALAVNLRVFGQWIAQWCRSDRAFDLAAAAVAVAEFRTPEFAQRLQSVAEAALRQRGLWDATAFAVSVQERRPIYAPPPTPDPAPPHGWNPYAA